MKSLKCNTLQLNSFIIKSNKLWKKSILFKCKFVFKLYEDNIICNLIYASKYYRTQQMIKPKKGIKPEKIFTENDIKIINEMHK